MQVGDRSRTPATGVAAALFVALSRRHAGVNGHAFGGAGLPIPSHPSFVDAAAAKWGAEGGNMGISPI